MARRQNVDRDEAMTPDDLKHMRQDLAALGRSAMLQAYQTAYARCRMVNDRIPSARSMQELVQVWKQLRTLRGCASGEPRA